MAQKHLHELLTEAQEPFLLKNYIADKRSKLKKPNSISNKTKSISKPSFCNQYCFYSNTQSPDFTDSPFSGEPFSAPEKNRAMLKITQFDLSQLLEAAEKIKGSNLGKTQKGIAGFGVFGSIIKKFKKSGGKCEKVESLGVFVKDEDSEKCFVLSPVSTCLSSQPNSPFASFRTPEYLSPVNFLPECLSPMTSPPEYSSPEISPVISDIQGDGDVECIPKKHCEEEEKDQFSPVSILDPPFEDDTEQHEDEDDEDDYECSYALVQRAKEQLLERLLRFEKLAELDPIELERSILETKTDDEDDDDDDDHGDEDLEDYKNDSVEKKFKFDMNGHMLVSDLIAKNKRKGDEIGERKIAAKMICKRVSFREKMEMKTKIDTIVEFDMRGEVDHGWKTNDRGLLEETTIEIELAILDLLIEELL